jgi:chromosome partitioning protein
MRRIIAIANQKGGVGKTETAINLSAALANFSRRVLLIDMDPQGNSSRGFGIDVSLINKSIYDVLMGKEDINKVIKKTICKNVDIISPKLILSNLETNLEGKVEEPWFLLRNSISNINKEYDYIIIDCPPSLGLITTNSLAAAESVLIPVQCEYFALSAVSQILASISSVQNTYNQNLSIEGFLLTMYDAKTRLCVEVSREIRGLFKDNTFLTMIPRNISIPESNSKGKPVIMYRPTSSGSLAYLALAREVMDHEKSDNITSK